jgi:hypothetical protein
MALKDYEEVRGRISRIQQRLNAELETIRQTQAYSDHGRKVEMAKLTVKARKEADAVKEKFLAARKARRESLEKRLFGIAGTPSATELMVMRDSRDRAATIGSAEEATTNTTPKAIGGGKLHFPATMPAHYDYKYMYGG